MASPEWSNDRTTVVVTMPYRQVLNLRRKVNWLLCVYMSIHIITMLPRCTHACAHSYPANVLGCMLSVKKIRIKIIGHSCTSFTTSANFLVSTWRSPLLFFFRRSVLILTSTISFPVSLVDPIARGLPSILFVQLINVVSCIFLGFIFRAKLM